MASKSKFTNPLALLLTLVILLTVFSLVGCTKKVDGKQNSSDVQSSSKASKASSDSAKSNSVKSDGYAKFSQLKIGMTESQVNAILGKPTKVDKAYYYYNITVNGKDLELNVWIDSTSGSVTNIYGDFIKSQYRAEFADSATDLSKASDLDSKKIKTYDACVTAFKTPGHLISIDDKGVKDYLWVDSNDGYLSVTIRADGSVKKYSGYC